MINVSHLEWHVTHSCNFTCMGCGHYTNDGYREDIEVENLREWYSTWSKKIRPRELCILGGEPLLHKSIVDIIYMTKTMWDIQDDQEFEVVSNGLLFDRVPDIAKALIDNNCVLTITKHSDDDNYVRLFDKSIDSIKKSGVSYRIHDSVGNWLQTYHGYGCSIEPMYSDDYNLSWDNCPTGQENFQLLDNMIYKCAPLAYLPLQKRKYGDKLSTLWNPYLNYIPLTSGASDFDVLEFFTKGAESVCSMCPKYKKYITKESPLHSPKYYERSRSSI